MQTYTTDLYITKHSYIKTHSFIYSFIHTYIHTYTHTHIHSYIHTYIHTNIQTNKHTNIYHRHIYRNTYVQTDRHIHSFMHSFIHTYVHTYIHTYIHTYRRTDGQIDRMGKKLTYLLRILVFAFVIYLFCCLFFPGSKLGNKQQQQTKGHFFTSTFDHNFYNCSTLKFSASVKNTCTLNKTF